MTTKSKWTAVRYTVEALGVLLLAIYVVMRYETQILAINWRLVSLVCVVAAAIFAIYRWQMRGDNQFDMLDVLATGPEGGKKLDNDKLYKAIFAGITIWVIIQQALAGEEVTALVLGALGFFVAKAALDGFSAAMGKRGPPIEGGDVNILQGAKVEPAAPKPFKPAAKKGR